MMTLVKACLTIGGVLIAMAVSFVFYIFLMAAILGTNPFQ
jgi:hypothetical protein